jgi:branched-chain amino acid transport system ATP-binding protein
MLPWEADPILVVDHLTMRFGGLVAINDLSFKAARGEITAVIGPNGAGKTTVFNCITGFYKPTEGRMVLRASNSVADEAIERLTAGARASFGQGDKAVHLLERMPDFQVAQIAHVARTFQNIRLFSGMTVLENLLVAQHNKLMNASGWSIKGILGLPSYGRAERAASEHAKHWLERVGLVDRADDPAGDLPYGDQRRLEIARALCSDPVLLCLDEPAAGLNPRESLELNTLLLSIKEKEKVSLLLIEHDMSVVMEISDHVVVLDYGTKISDGRPDSVKSDPKVIAAYLGVEDEALIELAGVSV